MPAALVAAAQVDLDEAIRITSLCKARAAFQWWPRNDSAEPENRTGRQIHRLRCQQNTAVGGCSPPRDTRESPEQARDGARGNEMLLVHSGGGFCTRESQFSQEYKRRTKGCRVEKKCDLRSSGRGSSVRRDQGGGGRPAPAPPRHGGGRRDHL
mmetsp:Transcript_3952/g.10149  ORF Transcript_3952/g.10149 Transcript_3952/m.10149 type:complete len:154 (-) Transcript_3952:49-510(-)